MDKTEWLYKVGCHRNKIVDIIGKYHPISLARGKGQSLPITAGNAERACTVVREQILKNSEGDPVADFDEALKDGNVKRLITLMSDTWFGVPESTACWNLTGFRELVVLMDDTP